MVACVAGFYCPANSTNMSLCPAGSACQRNLLCEDDPCAPGFYAPRVGMTTCFPCEPGWYSASPGQSACTQCKAGTYTAGTSATAESDCLPQARRSLKAVDVEKDQAAARNGGDGGDKAASRTRPPGVFQPDALLYSLASFAVLLASGIAMRQLFKTSYSAGGSSAMENPADNAQDHDKAGTTATALAVAESLRLTGTKGGRKERGRGRD